MLSPYELATLMLLEDSADQIADREELDTVLERRLAALEQLAGDVARPRIMQNEDPVLRSLPRVFIETTAGITPHAPVKGVCGLSVLAAIDLIDAAAISERRSRDVGSERCQTVSCVLCAESKS